MPMAAGGICQGGFEGAETFGAGMGAPGPATTGTVDPNGYVIILNGTKLFQSRLADLNRAAHDMTEAQQSTQLQSVRDTTPVPRDDHVGLPLLAVCVNRRSDVTSSGRPERR